MLRTKRLAVLLAAIAWAAAATVAAAQSPRSTRVTYNFDPGWKVHVGDAPGADAPGFADSAWKSVTLPYAWNENKAFAVSIHDLPTGIAWYRKHFKLPANSCGQQVFLEFEGIRQAGDFYLNGKFIGRSENGVMAFGFDITRYVRPAPRENVLAARIDNSWTYREKATNTPFQWNDRNFYANYGGINKNVFLHITSPLYQTLPLYANLGTTGVYVYAQDFDIPGRSAKITAESQVRNEYPTPKTFGYQAIIADPDGHVVRTFDGGRNDSGSRRNKDRPRRGYRPRPPLLELGLRLSVRRLHDPDPQWTRRWTSSGRAPASARRSSPMAS